MAISREVKCINKTDRYSRHERIRNIGGDWGTIPESDAIRHIEQGVYNYHVRVNGYDVKVIIATHEGRKYLKTETDSTTVDNLLSLNECR